MERIGAGLLTLSMVVFLGCHGDHDHDHGSPDVPAPYAGMSNPMDGDTAAAAAGEVIYTDNCVECHGADGRGDGVEAAELDPAPADFHEHTLRHDDDYLFWRISEGGNGTPVQSDMPAWKLELTDDQIWQVITYMRGL